jgi:DNA-binding NtrC family response regulator
MKVLLIDDEQSQRESLEGFLTHIGHTVKTASTGEDAMKIVEDESIEVVITDYRMPGMNGLEVTRAVKKRNPRIDILMITAYGDIDTAVDTIKAGAFDFLSKPVDLEQLRDILNRLAEHRQILAENTRLRYAMKQQARFDDIIFTSSAMENVLNLAARVADSKSSVLIRGETGVGKELVARAIHNTGPRNDMPFVAVNCSALNEHLLESELFGHEKGAFTGAVNGREGRFERASGGTLFLDEIGDMPHGVQIKLLRALQEKHIERVGSNTPIKVDVRLIAATHRDLKEEMQTGEFREDLYYRMNVVTIWVPPLRERREDIPVLAHAFLKKYCGESHREVEGFTPETMDLLTRHSYPGNVRELENAVERAVLLTRMAYIEPRDLPETIQNSHANSTVYAGESIRIPITGSMPEQVEQLEKAMLMHALEQSGGNQTQAAESIGISEKSVRDRIKKWNITVPGRSPGKNNVT